MESYLLYAPLPLGSSLWAFFTLGWWISSSFDDVSSPYPALALPRLKHLHGRQPPYLVNGSVAVSGYRWSSGPGGSVLWYCTISWESCPVRSASSKSRDLASVAFPRTSRFGSTPPSSLLLRVASAGTRLLLHPWPLFPSDLWAWVMVMAACVAFACVWGRAFMPAPSVASGWHALPSGLVSGGPTVATSPYHTLCNDPTIGSYNHYHLSPNGIPRGNQRWYGLVYLIQIAGKPRIRPRE